MCGGVGGCGGVWVCVCAEWSLLNKTLSSVLKFCVCFFLGQIVKILSLYTPVNEFEERVSILFIKSVQVSHFSLFLNAF